MGRRKAQNNFRKNNMRMPNGTLVAIPKEILQRRDQKRAEEKKKAKEAMQVLTAPNLNEEESACQSLLGITVDMAKNIIEQANTEAIVLEPVSKKLKWKDGADSKFRAPYTGDSRSTYYRKREELAVNKDIDNPDNKLITDFFLYNGPTPVMRKRKLITATANDEKKYILKSSRYKEICDIIRPQIKSKSKFGSVTAFQMVRHVAVKE